MLWTIIGIILVIWLAGFLLDFAGGLIHLLLIVAGIVFIFQLITGRRKL
ncbi:lmo0937 family membrane protein [Halalkalibacillus halophilus]|nr:lmo0937 family membrane protein [Halalkalibacillus halophilus]